MPAHAVSAADLPNDIDALKQLLIVQATHYETELQRLREQLNLLLTKRYGPSSGKISPGDYAPRAAHFLAGSDAKAHHEEQPQLRPAILPDGKGRRQCAPIRRHRQGQGVR